MPPLDTYTLYFYSYKNNFYTPIVWSTVVVGDPIRLIPQPQHPFDSNTVQVCSKGIHLGYLPRQNNRFFSKWLALWGHSYKARVQNISSFSPLHEKIEIELVREVPENKNAP